MKKVQGSSHWRLNENQEAAQWKSRGGVAHMCDQVELFWKLEGFQQAVESVVETLFCIHKWQQVRRATTESATAGRSSIIELEISFEISCLAFVW
jgi:hypothetical protein